MAKTTITTTTTVNTFLHHLGESKSRELNASSGCCWSMTYTARRRTGRMRIAAATSEKTHRRIVEKQATICHKLQAASWAVLSCWSCCRVVVRNPQQRVSYFICFRCIRILLATRLGNAIEQEFHIVFTASRRSLEEWSFGWAWEHTFGLDCSMLATGQSSTLQNFTVKLKKLQGTKERCKL